jgi:hypothetical protein
MDVGWKTIYTEYSKKRQEPQNSCLQNVSKRRETIYE